MPTEKSYPPEKLVPYDPTWTERYTALAADLMRVLGRGWTVQHVGSTSIPGLLAKPVIDLAVRLPDGARVEHWTEVVHPVGWSRPVLTGDHQASFLHDRGVRAAITHIFTPDQWPNAHVRLFADWLRGHAADREEYAELKTRLVRQRIWGSDYTEAKREFVQDVVNRARAARGLPEVTL